MKKLLYILFAVTLFVSCSDDDNGSEPTQDYTSFVVTIDSTNKFENCIAAYKKNDKYYKISELGNLTKNKYSEEVIVEDKTITEIYIFTKTIRFDNVYKLKNNKKNAITVINGTKGILIYDKTDPTQYPQ